ncbi:hypothetical protein GQ61_07365 [Candidatus Nucleicultrix amoebiphila FS5]|uniref:D-alanyl-D-alanine dipeptidase n=2 Tax=Candidatus Nucleicultrix TaxID=1509243 RepID=A0A1W6N5H5_9PROT|nr:hypothetical protein GQ61_07365 [Candidatus Nucleicultrix amoebiphila FS5]
MECVIMSKPQVSPMSLTLPEKFVYLHDIDATILTDIRYFKEDNFIGRPLPGYEADVCITVEAVAHNLSKIQKTLKMQGLSLLVFDSYRPQETVDYFGEWARNIEDQAMKEAYYPRIDKREVFNLGYIAARSSHSRGSAVDLTIVKLKEGGSYEELNMGTKFDYLDELSHTLNPEIQGEARENRLLLKTLMEENNFINYRKEWWHYNINEEPYPETYFNFPVK